MHKKSGALLIALGLLLIAAALFYAYGNVRQDMQAGEANAQVLQQLEQAILEPDAEAQAAAPSPSAQPDALTPRQDMSMVPMAVTEIDGYDYIGILEVPGIERQFSIMADWSYDQLDIAPCRYSGSYYTDDLVIAGHNYISHFYWIWNAGPHDELTLITVDKQVIHYVVDYVEIIGPNAVEYLCKKTDWDLSLFTCTASGALGEFDRNRVVLRCSRVESE